MREILTALVLTLLYWLVIVCCSATLVHFLLH